MHARCSDMTNSSSVRLQTAGLVFDSWVMRGSRAATHERKPMSRTRIAMLAIASLITLGTQAQAANDQPLTREQVRAEFFKARSEGTLPPSGENGSISQVSGTPSKLTRAEVLRELAASGPTIDGEVGDPDVLRNAKSLRTRAEVHAEAVALVRSGARIGGEQ
ncbi:MAG: hypothetical protein DI587_35650 [Variovorax paradoxus]|nr:MAG: hypothetical protein DI583_35650 [Variovorax paradoxus]PZQ01119.1 MAG: hypothetical protein DI587_35650 [Variovorax paradoxus]